jgi:hypothetical protein
VKKKAKGKIVTTWEVCEKPSFPTRSDIALMLAIILDVLSDVCAECVKKRSLSNTKGKGAPHGK